jgi:hypothetical protein
MIHASQCELRDAPVACILVRARKQNVDEFQLIETETDHHNVVLRDRSAIPVTEAVRASKNSCLTEGAMRSRRTLAAQKNSTVYVCGCSAFSSIRTVQQVTRS